MRFRIILSWVLIPFLLCQWVQGQGLPTPKQAANGKWGYQDGAGKWMLRPKFQFADTPSHGYLRVKHKGTWRFLHVDGSPAFEKQEFQNAQVFTNGMAAVKPMGQNKWGFIDTTGQLVIQPLYVDVEAFDKYGYALCFRNGNLAGYTGDLIDRSGKSNKAWFFAKGDYDSLGRSLVEISIEGNRGYAYFSGVSGTFITEAYDAPFRLGEARQKVRQASEKHLIGMIGPDGTPVSGFYSTLKPFVKDLLIASVDGFAEGSRLSVVDQDFNEIVPGEFSKIEVSEAFILLHGYPPSRTFLVLDHDLDTLSGPFEASSFETIQGLYMVTLTNREKVLLSPAGRVVNRGIVKIEGAGEGMFKIQQAFNGPGGKYVNRYAYLDRNGRQVSAWYDYLNLNEERIDHREPTFNDYVTAGVKLITGAYFFEWAHEVFCNRSSGYSQKNKEFIGGQFHQGMAAVGAQGPLRLERKGDQERRWFANTYGYVDSTGKLVVKPSYDFAFDFSEGRGAVCKKNKFGFINAQGKVVIPLIYDDVSSFSEGLASVKIGGKYGFVDVSGKMVIPARFFEAYYFSEGLAAASDGKLWGFIDKQGKWVIPPSYVSVTSFVDGRAAVMAKPHSAHTYIQHPSR